jgi:hypothetical protein
VQVIPELEGVVHKTYIKMLKKRLNQSEVILSVLNLKRWKGLVLQGKQRGEIKLNVTWATEYS